MTANRQLQAGTGIFINAQGGRHLAVVTGRPGSTTELKVTDSNKLILSQIRLDSATGAARTTKLKARGTGIVHRTRQRYSVSRDDALMILLLDALISGRYGDSSAIDPYITAALDAVDKHLDANFFWGAEVAKQDIAVHGRGNANAQEQEFMNGMLRAFRSSYPVRQAA